MGTPDDVRNAKALHNIRLAGKYYPVVYGMSIAAPIWKSIMDAALAGTPNVPFPAPSDHILKGETIDIPDVARRSIADAQALLQQAGFGSSVAKVYSNYRAGTVVGTSPRGQATRGSVVRLLVSMGPPPAPPPTATAPAATPPPGG